MGTRIKQIRKPLSTSQQEEKQKLGGSLIQSGGESAFAGGTAPSSSAGQPTQAAPSATQQIKASEAAGQTRGTGFTGASKYLQAAQGTQLGQQVAGRITQAGQQATQALGEAKKQFQTGLQQQQQQFEEAYTGAQGALEGINYPLASSQPVTRPPKNSPAVMQKTSGPTFEEPSAEQIRQYGIATSGRYSGPGGISQLAAESAKRKLASASQLAQSARSAAGREGLLRETVGRGSTQYTGGKSALDALLLGQKAGEFAKAQRETAGVAQKFGLEEKRAEEQVRQTQSQMAGQAQKLAQQRDIAERQLKEQGLARIAAFERDMPTIMEKIKSDIRARNLSPETQAYLEQFGVSPGSRFLGLSLDELSNLFSQKYPAIGLSEALKEEEARKINALRKLTGTSQEYLDIGKAGIGLDKQKAISFDKAKLEELLKTRRVGIEEQAKTTLEAIRTALKRLDVPSPKSWIDADPQSIQKIYSILFPQSEYSTFYTGQAPQITADPTTDRTNYLAQAKARGEWARKRRSDLIKNLTPEQKKLYETIKPVATRIPPDVVTPVKYPMQDAVESFLKTLVSGYIPYKASSISADALGDIFSDEEAEAAPSPPSTTTGLQTVDLSGNLTSTQPSTQPVVQPSIDLNSASQILQESINSAISSGNTITAGTKDPVGQIIANFETQLAQQNGGQSTNIIGTPTEEALRELIEQQIAAQIQEEGGIKPSYLGPPTVYGSGGKNYSSEDEDSPLQQAASASALKSLGKGKQISRPVGK